MGFSQLMATANADIFSHLGDDEVVGGKTVRAMFDFQEIETAAGYQMAPVLTVSPSDAALIAKGDAYSHDSINYVVDLRHPNNEGMIVLELKHA